MNNATRVSQYFGSQRLHPGKVVFVVIDGLRADCTLLLRCCVCFVVCFRLRLLFLLFFCCLFSVVVVVLVVDGQFLCFV